jgi:hypothetical protein
MPDISGQFNGQQIILPGAYSAVNDSGTLTSVSTNVPPVIYIGNGYGQQPFTAVTYASPSALLAAIRGGPAAAYVQEMFTPSGQINGASLVTFINASENTQSSASLKDSAAATVITMTSANYGLPSNQLQYTVTAGTVGGIELELYDGYSGQALLANNLGIPFQIAYLGSGTVTYTVTSTALTITSSNASESLTITFGAGGYTTVSQAVNYINGTGNFVASVVSNANLPLTSLDLVSAISLPVPTSGSPNFVSITAYLGDIVWWLNNEATSLIGSAAIANGITSSSSTVPVATPATHFTGATSVPPTNADYATAFNVALTIPGWVVFADSNSPAVQALGAQHVITASNATNRRPRRFVTGSTAGDSIAVTLTNAKSLAAKQVAYCYPGIYVTNTTTGVSTLQGGLYWAAGVAGAMAGNPVNMPLTYKTFTGNGVETQLPLAEINQLQNSGVFVLYVDDYTGLPTTASDVSTWQADANPSNVFLQQVGIDQYLQYVVQQATQPYTGTVASNFSSTVIRKAVVAALNAQVISANNQNGVLDSWDTSSLTFSYNEQLQATAISFNCTPVGQNRFIFTQIYVEALAYSTSS